MAARLAAILAGENGQLSRTERICAELVRAQHQDMATAIGQVKAHLVPLNSIGAGGVQFSFLESLEWLRLDSHADLQVALARLRACPTQLSEFQEAMRSGIASRITASAPMMRRVDAHLQRLAEGDAPFDELQPALALCDRLGADRAPLLEAGAFSSASF